LTTDVLARLWFGPAFGLPDGLPGVGFLRSHDAYRRQTKNDRKQEAIASIKGLRAPAVNEEAVHALGKQ
jgi:hypothetical protein